MGRWAAGRGLNSPRAFLVFSSDCKFTQSMDGSSQASLWSPCASIRACHRATTAPSADHLWWRLTTAEQGRHTRAADWRCSEPVHHMLAPVRRAHILPAIFISIIHLPSQWPSWFIWLLYCILSLVSGKSAAGGGDDTKTTAQVCVWKPNHWPCPPWLQCDPVWKISQ